jgi:hypothetical protein
MRTIPKLTTISDLYNKILIKFPDLEDFNYDQIRLSYLDLEGEEITITNDDDV